MRFIHIADVHLGAHPEIGRPWAKEREEEIILSFKKVIECCKKEEVDLLLIAGDLFHRQPLIRELKEVNYYFQKLTNTKVVLIAGNHDYIGARSNYSEFNWNENVFMLDSEEMDSIFIEEINTEVYGFSYHSRDIYEPRYQKAAPTVEERTNILLAHGGDDRDIPIDAKHLSGAGFDYIALGHIHKAEIICDKMAYAGSLEALDKNELGDHGYIKGEITKHVIDSYGNLEGITKIEFVSSGARRYHKLILTITQKDTSASLLEMIEEEIQKIGNQHLYRIYIDGIRDIDLIIDKEAIEKLGLIVDLIDRTVPDYDFEKLHKENNDNIIGMYIERIWSEAAETETSKKALYYGLEALLHHKS